MEELKDSVSKSLVENNRIVIDTQFFSALLKIMGYAVACIENGNIYEAREILSQAGETIYQKYESILVEE